VLADDTFLVTHIDAQCTGLEQRYQLSTQRLVRLAVQECDVVLAENLLGTRSQEQLEVSGQVEDEAGDIGVFAEQNEPA